MTKLLLSFLSNNEICENHIWLSNIFSSINVNMAIFWYLLFWKGTQVKTPMHEPSLYLLSKTWQHWKSDSGWISLSAVLSFVDVTIIRNMMVELWQVHRKETDNEIVWYDRKYVIEKIQYKLWCLKLEVTTFKSLFLLSLECLFKTVYVQ